MLEDLKMDLVKEVDFAIAESFDDLICGLMEEVSVTETLFPIVTNTKTPKLTDVTSYADMTTEVKVAIKNYLAKELNSSKNLVFTVRDTIEPPNGFLEAKNSLKLPKTYIILLNFFYTFIHKNQN